MGRIKKDHTGYTTMSLWKKYKYPEVFEKLKPKTKKDTKRWCRGKVGVEHDYDLTEEYESVTFGRILQTFRCRQCGRKYRDLIKP
jgi:hypothetical protein